MMKKTTAGPPARAGRTRLLRLLLVLGLAHIAGGCAPLRVGSWEGPPDPPRPDEQCTILRWHGQHFPEMFIRKPGKYCIDRDYTADLRGCLHGCSGAFVDIRADDVELDLRGHVLTSNGGAFGGITAYVSNNVTIRNGTIRGVSGGEGIAMTSKRKPGGPRSIYADKPPADFAGYDMTVRATIENMTIESVGMPIDVVGPNVVVRNNRIRATVETDDRPAERRAWFHLYLHTLTAVIAIYGPNARIEGNVIEQTTYTGGQGPAPTILLRDANDAVVRGNRIVNRGDRAGTSAVGLKDSVNVRIENNSFKGIEQPVWVHGEGSSYAFVP